MLASHSRFVMLAEMRCSEALAISVSLSAARGRRVWQKNDAFGVTGLDLNVILACARCKHDTGSTRRRRSKTWYRGADVPIVVCGDR